MSQGIRDRVRAELIREIKDVARRHLAEHGAPALSVRAVTRDLGMASSAVYRYFPNRDSLLTALIIDAYDALGDAAETADGSVGRDDYLGRWRAIFHAVRTWARDHPHEYALLYGTPVPGYRAPDDTVEPAVRVALLLAQITIDAAAQGQLHDVPSVLTPGLQSDASALAAGVAARAPERSTEADADLAARTALKVVDAWTRLCGTVSFELFGHYHRVIQAGDEYLDRLALMTADDVGLPPP